MSAEGAAPAPTIPARSCRGDLGDVFPSTPMRGMLHGAMETVTVRVVPRSGRSAVETAADGTVTIRVRAAPAEGAATREATKLLAAHFGVAPSAVRLRIGHRSRVKVFEIDR
jgi:uncharacterized protein YggU (UPF0235/DUF167 family)